METVTIAYSTFFNQMKSKCINLGPERKVYDISRWSHFSCLRPVAGALTELMWHHLEVSYNFLYPGEGNQANKARLFTSSACVNLIENWCKEYFRVLSVFFKRQLLVFTEKHILVIFNIYIIFFIISILDITNYLCLGDINVL